MEYCGQDESYIAHTEYTYMVNFSALKKASSSSLERITSELEKINNAAKTSKEEDTRFWQPTVDKAGNGSAIIRFLPTSKHDGEDSLPWVKIFNHGFQGPTGLWYIENSLTTLGQKDPASDLNSKLWNSTKDDNSPARKQARNQKRRLTYISNIYVISDPFKKENEGKVFLYKYGKKIFDKIMDSIDPPFDEMGRPRDHADYDPTNAVFPFDLWKGANFRLKMRMVDGYRNYDLSQFDSPGPLKNSDEELEKIWEQEHSLKEFLDPKNFKSYEALEKHLNKVLNLEGTTTLPQSTTVTEKPKSLIPQHTSDDEEDEDLKAFKALAN